MDPPRNNPWKFELIPIMGNQQKWMRSTAFLSLSLPPLPKRAVWKCVLCQGDEWSHDGYAIKGPPVTSCGSREAWRHQFPGTDDSFSQQKSVNMIKTRADLIGHISAVDARNWFEFGQVIPEMVCQLSIPKPVYFWQDGLYPLSLVLIMGLFRPRAYFGGFRANLGSFWAYFGWLGHVGPILAHFRDFFGKFWCVMGHSGPILEGF